MGVLNLNTTRAMTLQELTAQTPVGECFEWKGGKYKVCEQTGTNQCNECDFRFDITLDICKNSKCLIFQRADKKNVVFVKQTPNEK